MDKQISAILKEKDLIPIKNFDNFTGTFRFRVLLCKDKNNKKFIFKYTNLKESYLKEKLEREAIITNVISKSAKEHDFAFSAPIFIKYSTSNFPSWSIHEYAEGTPLGSVFRFNKKLNVDDSRSLIARILPEIQSIDKSYIDNFYKLNHIETRNKNWYLNKKTENNKFLKETFDNIFNEKIDLLFQDCHEFPCVLTHEDLLLENIICNQEKKLTILDWEHFTFDNPAEDISHIWVYSWKNPEWRNKLLKEFISNSKIDEKNILSSFRVAAVMRLIYRIRWWGTDPKIRQYNTKISLINHKKDLESIIYNKFL